MEPRNEKIIKTIVAESIRPTGDTAEEVVSIAGIHNAYAALLDARSQISSVDGVVHARHNTEGL